MSDVYVEYICTEVLLELFGGGRRRLGALLFSCVSESVAGLVAVRLRVCLPFLCAPLVLLYRKAQGDKGDKGTSIGAIHTCIGAREVHACEVCAYVNMHWGMHKYPSRIFVSMCTCMSLSI